MLHLLNDFVSDSVLFSFFFEIVALFKAGVCTGDDKETGEEDPGGESGEEVVTAGNGVQA